MMKEKKKGLLQRGIMVAVSALTIVSGAGTVLAYEPMLSSDESFSDVISDESLDVFAYNSSEFDPLAFLDFSKSNSIFIDNNGIQLACDESLSPYALCTHSMIDGTFYTHSKNSSGGCTVKKYSCQKCKKCGYRANAVLQSTHTYVKCPH